MEAAKEGRGGKGWLQCHVRRHGGDEIKKEGGEGRRDAEGRWSMHRCAVGGPKGDLGAVMFGRFVRCWMMI